MSSTVIKIVRTVEEQAVAKTELLAGGYTIIAEERSDIIALDLSKFDSDETILNDAITIVGYSE